MRLALLSAFLALPLLAQTCPPGFVCTPVPPPPVTTPPVFTSAASLSCPTLYGAFAGYSTIGSPKWTGGGLIAPLFPGVQCAPGTLQLRSYTQYIESPIKVNGAWTLQQTISTGAALPVYKLPFGEVWMLGTIGAAVTGVSSTAKLGNTYGGGISMKLFKTGWTVFPAYQKVNGMTEVVLAIMK